MKLVIGLTGHPLSGKETFMNVLEALLKKDGFSMARSRGSDIIRETLTLWNIPHGRENEQLLAQVMVRPDAFKEGALSRALEYRLHETSADVGLIDGVRWHSDEAMIRNFDHGAVKNIMVYVTAGPDRRFERLKIRNRSGEGAMTREEFDRRDKMPNEIDITDIGSRAEIKFLNDHGAIADFEKEIAETYARLIKPLLL